ncbi:NUMOD4 domain-containing protein [Clostridium butyricum]|uniref:NUMOD4 domain-containing protein n=1 Tax=Clostridium butyricum TaxID=1492 RepID=UPI0032C049FE
MIKADFELWKDVKGYEGLYQVSNLGRIKSLDMIVIHYNGKKERRKGRVLKLSENEKGYLKVFMCKNKKRECKKVHRVVAETFIPNRENLPEVNHKDENKKNNSVYNLEWCTHRYNCNYGTHNLNVSKSKTNGNNSKTVYQYDLNKNIIKVWTSLNEAGRNGFSVVLISRCCLGKGRTHKGFIWSYEPL